MKVLFAGLGSIGARHLRNLSALCAKLGIALEVTALRSGLRPLTPELEVLVARQITEVPDSERFTLAFITNPTHLHAATLEALRGKAEAFFIEKPIFEATDYDLDVLGLGETQKAYVAAPMRWCGVYLALKEQLAQTQPYSVRAICSSYLPDWRKGVDYRTVYSAKRAMGGGVTLDLIHEWDYLADLFGIPLQCHHFSGKFSHLEIDADDLSVYIAQYANFLCELHLDYFGRGYRRDIEIFTKEGTLSADFGSGLLTLQDGTVQDYAEDANRRYEREMEYFLEYALRGDGESLNSPRHALSILRLALGE